MYIKRRAGAKNSCSFCYKELVLAKKDLVLMKKDLVFVHKRLGFCVQKTWFL